METYKMNVYYFNISMGVVDTDVNCKIQLVERKVAGVG